MGTGKGGDHEGVSQGDVEAILLQLKKESEKRGVGHLSIVYVLAF